MKTLEPIKQTEYKPDILIIDDDRTISRILTMVLTRAGYTTRSAVTAREGLNEALRKTPDAVLLDYMLPERSGLDILADFRQSIDLVDTPVIMLTASTEVSVVKSAIIKGVNDYLLKPVDPETLIQRLSKLLGSRAPAQSSQQTEEQTPSESTASHDADGETEKKDAACEDNSEEDDDGGEENQQEAPSEVDGDVSQAQ